MKKHLLAVSLLLTTLTSFGAGYQINLEGLRQVAMGGTGVAWPWDAATIFYNPGGLARLKSIQAYVSVSAIMPATAFGNQMESGNTPANATTARQTFTPFNVYIGGPVQENSRISLGLGIYTPAGSGLQWDNNWLGRYLVQSVQLKCVFFQPTLAYKINDFLSVGAGFVYGTGVFDFTQALPVHGANGAFDGSQASLHGNAVGAGFNAGVNIRVSEQLQLGVSYRSQVNMGISSGSAKFTVPSSLRDSFPNTHFDSQLPVPQVITAGIGYRTGNWTFQADFNYTIWNSFDSLRFNFDQHTSSLKNMHAPRHYHSIFTPRVGAHFKVSKVVALMAGGAYDPSPVPNGYVSPDLPDANRIIVTGGITIKPIPRFTIIAACEAASGVKRHASYDFGGFEGTYKTEAVAPGIALYYNF